MENMVNKKIHNKEQLEKSIKKCLSFVKEIEYLSLESNLIYVKVLGGLGIAEIEALALESLKLRYANPIQITTKYDKIVNGLSISLEVLI
jgi:hypothetical protein